MSGYEDILVGYTPPIPWPSFNTFVFLGFVTSFSISFHESDWGITFRLTPIRWFFWGLVVSNPWFASKKKSPSAGRTPEIQRTPQKKLETLVKCCKPHWIRATTPPFPRSPPTSARPTFPAALQRMLRGQWPRCAAWDEKLRLGHGDMDTLW